VTQPEVAVLIAGASVFVGDGAMTIERRAGTDAKPIVRLSGCSSREAAEALRGTPLLARRDALAPLENDEFWSEDLVGCAVVDGERPVGKVSRLLGLPSVEVLQVERPEGSPLLVPLVRDAIRSVDLDARRIDIDLEFLGEA
jgi:16S rRNA processing protein RimM